MIKLAALLLFAVVVFLSLRTLSKVFSVDPFSKSIED